MASVGFNAPLGLSGQVDARIYKYFSLGAGIGYFPSTNIYPAMKYALGYFFPVPSSIGLNSQNPAYTPEASIRSLKYGSLSYELLFNFYPYAGPVYFGFGLGYNETTIEANTNITFTGDTSSFPAEIQSEIAGSKPIPVDIVAKFTRTYLSPHIGIFAPETFGSPFQSLRLGTEIGAMIMWTNSQKITRNSGSAEQEAFLESQGLSNQISSALESKAGVVGNAKVIPYWNVIRVGIELP